MHDAHDRYMLHITQLFLLPAAQCVGTLVTQTARCAPECGHQLTSDHWDHSDHGDISVEPCPHPAPGKLQDQADIALLTSSIPTHIYLHATTAAMVKVCAAIRRQTVLTPLAPLRDLFSLLQAFPQGGALASPENIDRVQCQIR